MCLSPSVFFHLVSEVMIVSRSIHVAANQPQNFSLQVHCSNFSPSLSDSPHLQPLPKAGLHHLHTEARVMYFIDNSDYIRPLLKVC